MRGESAEIHQGKAGPDVRRELRRNVKMAPEAIFASIADEPYSFFLDSAMPDQRLSRYSFMGSRPFLVFSARGRRYVIREGRRTVRGSGEPIAALGRLLARFRMDPRRTAPPLLAGAVGFIGYEAGDILEPMRLREKPARGKPAGLGMPHLLFAFYESVLAYDLARREVWVPAGGLRGKTGGLAERQRGRARTLLKLCEGEAGRAPGARFRLTSPLVPDFSRGEYMAAVESVKEAIARGDIYQANLTQQFGARFAGSPFELYGRLRRISPAPFGAYLNFGPFRILSSSPERFLRVRGSRVETRPIKGTRPRGSDRDSDRARALELIKSAKDLSEHVMIVDLERNDLGRICETGSVCVSELAALEVYPQVFHLTSTVEGRLRRGAGCIDALRLLFPGGSITGAPKIRSREILAQLERSQREIYTGALGYIDFSGGCDFNIVIRTIAARGNSLKFGVGGGIVADSEPKLEYEESLHKARGIMAAMGEAQRSVIAGPLAEVA